MVAIYQILPFVAMTLSTPVLLDPEIYPNEISVYFDREKWCFIVVGVVNMIEISEQLAGSQTSISLYGNITRELDIQDLMSEMVLNMTDPELSALEKIEAMSQHGWLENSDPKSKKASLNSEAKNTNTFNTDYQMIFLLTLFIAFVSGIIAGLGLAMHGWYRLNGNTNLDDKLAPS